MTTMAGFLSFFRWFAGGAKSSSVTAVIGGRVNGSVVVLRATHHRLMYLQSRNRLVQRSVNCIVLLNTTKSES